MNFGRRVALLAALAVLAAVATGITTAGTTARTAPEASGKSRLTAFGTCGQLLGYAKTQAKRFVGPYGFGGGSIIETAVPGAPVATSAA